MVKNGCGQSSHGTLKVTVSEKLNISNRLVSLHAGTNLGKLKVDSMIFGWVWSKMAEVF